MKLYSDTYDKIGRDSERSLAALYMNLYPIDIPRLQLMRDCR